MQEAWEAEIRNLQSVILYVLAVQEKLAKMAELVKENLAQAQSDQKKWYDDNARNESSRQETMCWCCYPL